MTKWYDNRKYVVELMEFLMDCELIVTPEDVIDIMKNAQRYDEVWRLYQKQINGVY